ncbi:hypothetical protein RJT34_31396 [Clitoria ternatea]|uniref:Uncharacterized protein n=1 Tax=Clitoria ternatea TaxID=43366 RepID=A0AAN9I3J1_CLITE
MIILLQSCYEYEEIFIFIVETEALRYTYFDTMKRGRGLCTSSLLYPVSFKCNGAGLFIRTYLFVQNNRNRGG